MSTFAYIAFLALCFGFVIASMLWHTRRDRQKRILRALYDRAAREEWSK